MAPAPRRLHLRRLYMLYRNFEIGRVRIFYVEVWNWQPKLLGSLINGIDLCVRSCECVESGPRGRGGGYDVRYVVRRPFCISASHEWKVVVLINLSLGTSEIPLCDIISRGRGEGGETRILNETATIDILISCRVQSNRGSPNILNKSQWLHYGRGIFQTVRGYTYI